MKLITNFQLLSLLLVLFSALSCRKAPVEVIEKTILKEVGTEIIEKITKNSAKEVSELGLSKEVKDFVFKNFDDDLTKQFLQIASKNKDFLTYAQSNPTFLNTWQTFAETNFASNTKQLRWINSELVNEKFTLKKVGGNVELLDSKTNNSICVFEKDRIVVKKAGKGGKDLNPLLNMRPSMTNKYPLLPNAHYKLENSSFFIDELGRVKKMVCPIMSNETKVVRSPIEQGLSKKLKDGIVVVDKSGNPIKVKAGYYKYRDDGGHYLANVHGGISEQINVIPMSNNANKIHFKKIENQLSKAISQGKTVKDYTVISKYSSKSRRPDKFHVSYYIDGEYFSKTIFNN